MTKSEIHRLAVKKRQWDDALVDFDKWWKKTKRGAKKEIKYMMNWLFFYKSEDSGEKALHILAVLAVDIIILRFLGFI